LQNGLWFFLISLKTFGHVDVMTLKQFVVDNFNKKYDYVFIDAKIQVDYNADIILLNIQKN